MRKLFRRSVRIGVGLAAFAIIIGMGSGARAEREGGYVKPSSSPQAGEGSFSIPTVRYLTDPESGRRWPASLEWPRPLPLQGVSVPGIASNPGAIVFTPSSLPDIFDTVRRFRNDPWAMDGPCGVEDVVVVGVDPPDEVVVFDRDTTIVGDICIVNQGELRVEGADLTLIGDITVQHGGSMIVNGGASMYPRNSASSTAAW